MSDTSTTLIAVRHGETEWNAAGRAQGHLNSPLTRTGRMQAALLAEGLIDSAIDVIVSSDLGRAIETCEPIATKLGLPYVTDSGLRERHLGLYQGLTRSEFEAKHPLAYAAYKSDCSETPIPGGGESREQLLCRCVEAAQRHCELNCGKTVLIVCHGGVLDSFFYHALQVRPGPLKRFATMNGSKNTFEISNGIWKLMSWGDVSHLHSVRTVDDY